MIPEKRIRNEGDRQELMAEELASNDLEGEELELGHEPRRAARPLAASEVPERAAPATETSEGSTPGVEIGEAEEVEPERRGPTGGEERRAGRKRRSSAMPAAPTARRGRTVSRGRRKTSAEKRSSRRPKAALARSGKKH